jgi:hypothetical protein
MNGLGQNFGLNSRRIFFVMEEAEPFWIALGKFEMWLWA